MKIFKKVFSTGLVMSLMFGFNFYKVSAGNGTVKEIDSETKVSLTQQGDSNDFGMKRVNNAYRLRRSKPFYFEKSDFNENNNGKLVFDYTFDENISIVRVERPIPIRVSYMDYEFYK